MDQEFILISYDEESKIDGAAFYRAPLLDAYKAGQSRAVIAGSKKFQVYRLQKDGEGITFTKIEKKAKGEGK